MNEVIQFIKDFDIQTLLSFGILCWFMTRSIRNEIKAEIKEIREEVKLMKKDIAGQAKRSDRLYQMFIDLLKDRK